MGIKLPKTYEERDPNGCREIEDDIGGGYRETWVLMLLQPLVFCDPGQVTTPSHLPLPPIIRSILKYWDSTVCLVEVSSLKEFITQWMIQGLIS